MGKTPVCGGVHCWHVKSSTTDGMGKAGYDNVFCCFCGKVAIRRWRYVRDPEHGSYADLLLRDEDKPEEPEGGRKGMG